MTQHKGDLEEVLQFINRKCIALDPGECQRNVRILNCVLDTLIPKMSEKDRLFKRLMKGKFYGGSYFDRLRVGEPNEFDVGFLLCIPRKQIDSLSTTHMPGFVKLKCNHYVHGLKKLCNFKSDLVASKVYSWFRSVLTRTMNDCFDVTSEGQYTMRFNVGEFTATLHFDMGPAATLKLHRRNTCIDIDLVPYFELSEEYWPGCGYRKNPYPKTVADFFIVPKSPRQRKRLLGGREGEPRAFNTYWRLSFQKQERLIMKDRGRLKPTLKLLKRLRDAQGHTVVSSYCIKNVLVSECAKNQYDWSGTLAQTFLDMLQAYLEYLKQDIPYFWHEGYQLLDVKPDTKKNLTNRLEYIYKDIVSDPYKVIEYLKVDFFEV